MQINGVTIYNDDLRQMLSLTEKNSLVVENLVKPRDKQNVPNATKFLLTFISTIRNINEKSLVLPYRLLSIKSELYLLSYVYEGILSFYVYTDLSISLQLKAFSVAAHCLLYLFRKNRSKLLTTH